MASATLDMATVNLESSIDRVVHAVTNEADVEHGLRLFLQGIVQLTRSDGGTVYRLFLDKSKYLMLASYDDRSGAFRYCPPDPGLNVSILTKPPNPSASLLERAIVTRSVRSQYGSNTCIPVVRGGSCLGALSLDSSKAVSDNYVIEVARGLLLSLFERQASLELLRAVQRPINYTQSLEDFLDDILLLIAEASRMPFIQIHELDEEANCLRCIASYGFASVEKSLFDCDPLEAFPPFAKAARGGPTAIVSSMDASDSERLKGRPESQGVKSLVVAPIKVGSTSGGAIFGTLSFGAACPFDYSALEIAGFESIANGIGTAITNSRNAHELRDISIADERVSLSISGLEVAQAARHEVRGAVDDCKARLVILQRYLKAPQENAAEIAKAIGKFDEQLSNIIVAIDKIKNASRQPDDKLEAASLLEIWREARALVSTKLEQEHIQARISSVGKERDLQVEVLPDALRHAFLHLLLNSIDAFKSRRKSDRLITVTLDPHSASAMDIKIRYTDNATGIDPSQFKQWTEADPSKDIKTLIFEKGITTKSSGSGYGLYLARMILARHHGSIELVSYRNGVVFDITVPKDLRFRMEREGKR